MASKLHCDICDDTTGVRSSLNEEVRVENPHTPTLMGRPVRVLVSFEPLDRRGRDSDDDRSQHVDLCVKCQRNAVEDLLSRKMGGGA